MTDDIGFISEPTPMGDMVNSFYELFRGNDRSFGLFNPGTRTMRTEDGEFTKDHVHRHLTGEEGLGVVPIMDTGYCWFGVIDIDNHKGEEMPVFETLRKIHEKRMPLILCRSKSGGMHLYLFGAEPLNAPTLRSMLRKWATDLGFPGVEVFPKQSRLSIDPESGERDKGNWINLPYFSGEATDRYAMKYIPGDPDDNVPSGMEQYPNTKSFFMAAEQASVTNFDLEKQYLEDHPDAPPCVQRMIIEGVESGARNEALYNIALYLKKAFPDDYQDKAYDLNSKIFDKPLPHNEAKKTVRSAGRRAYKYRCQQEPCKGLCDSATCLKRKYGITPTQDAENQAIETFPELSNLRKYDTDPVKWELSIEGRDVNMTTSTLMNYVKFRERVAETIMRMLPVIKNKDWDKMLEPLMADVTLIEAPDEASAAGLIRERLRAFLGRADMDFTDMEAREGLLRGLPVAQKDGDELQVWFCLTDFVDHLKRTKSEELKGTELFLALRKMGVKHKRIRIKKKVTPVWYLELKEEDKTPELETPDYDLGF